VKIFFPLKTKKQHFLLNISKSRGGMPPTPLPTSMVANAENQFTAVRKIFKCKQKSFVLCTFSFSYTLTLIYAVGIHFAMHFPPALTRRKNFQHDIWTLKICEYTAVCSICARKSQYILLSYAQFPCWSNVLNGRSAKRCHCFVIILVYYVFHSVTWHVARDYIKHRQSIRIHDVLKPWNKKYFLV